MEISKFRESLNLGKTTLTVLQGDLKDNEKLRDDLYDSIKDHKEVQALFQRAAEITQEKLAIHLSDLVSLALKTVFKDPYKFKVDFISKRGSTECDLLFVDEKGNEYQPLNSCGYGAADVASFALRVAYHSLGNTRSALVFDEPFRQVAVDLMDKVSELVKSLSKELTLQFIIITHNKELAGCADRGFAVTQENRISKIKSIEY